MLTPRVSLWKVLIETESNESSRRSRFIVSRTQRQEVVVEGAHLQLQLRVKHASHLAVAGNVYLHPPKVNVVTKISLFQASH
jgi:hypothetical protein